MVLSDSVISKTFEVSLDQWNPVDFLNDQSLSRDQRDIGKSLVYCGDQERAFVTTVSDYVAKQWPSCGKNVLGGIQELCKTKQSVSGKVLQCDIDIRIKDDDTRLVITGDRTTALMITEVCVFICMACQIPENASRPGYATPLLKGPGTGFGHVRVSAIVKSLEQTSAANGLCWLAMVNNPVLAYRYPIPGRPSDMLGLEIDFRVLLLLSGVEAAWSIARRFVMKSHFSALVPTSVTGGCMAWHLCYKLPYVPFKDAFAVNTQSSVASNYDFATLSDGYRHIVGWTPNATVTAGTGAKDVYDVKYTTAGSAELTELRVDDFLIGGSFKVSSSITANFSVLCNLYKRDKSAKLSSAETFGDIITQSAGMRVPFYGQDDARAWLIDGRSALLHLTKQTLTTADTLEGIKDAKDRKEVPVMQLPAGHHARETLEDTKKMNIVLTDGGDGEESTIRDCVIGHWYRLEAMEAAFHEAKFGHQLTMSWSDPTGPQLVGFEFVDVVEPYKPRIRPYQVTLKQSAKQW